MRTYIKHVLKKICRPYLILQVNCNKLWLGNKYGGFYVCPDLLNDTSIVYSFGIGEDISFDNMIIERFGCSVHAFDPTPKSITWIKEQKLPEAFIFNPYGLGTINGFTRFYLPQNPEHVSGSLIVNSNVSIANSIEVPMKTFVDIVREYGHTSIDVLKMDIEGAEYSLLESILNSNIKIDQILIEFHDRLFHDGKKKTKDAIRILNIHGYHIFAISDSLEEISFVKIHALSKKSK